MIQAWDPAPLIAASCRTLFSDPFSDLESDPFRTRFWHPFLCLFGVFFGPVSELAVRVAFVLSSWPLLGVQDSNMSAFWVSSGLFKQLGDTKTIVKYSVFVVFSKSTRTADAEPLGPRLGALLCLLLAFWGAL